MTTPNNTVAGLAEKLLPCPFCGAESEMKTIAEYQGYSAREAQSMGMGVSAGGFTSTSWAIECECGIRIPGNNDDLLRARWNRRASPAPSAGVGVEAPPENCTATEWLDFANGNSVGEVAAALQHPAAPSAPPSVAGDADFLRHVASVCRGAVDLCEPKPQRTPEDDREHNGGLCLSELANIADEIERRVATAEQPGSAVQGEVVHGGVYLPRYFLDFLLGQGQLEGFWFGDKPATERGPYWWRSRLRALNRTTPPAPAAEQGDPRAQYDASGRLIAYDARGGGMYTQPEARGVEGWVLVPVEPTHEMELALSDALASGDYSIAECLARAIAAALSANEVSRG